MEQPAVIRPYSDTLDTLPCIASRWCSPRDDKACFGHLTAEFHSGQRHGPAPSSLRIVFSPDTIDERGIPKEADPASQLALMISSDHLGKPLTIVTPERDEIPLYIQDLLVGLRDIHGKEAIQAGGVHYIPLQLLGPPMVMAPNNPGALKSDMDLENLMAFRKLSTRTQLKLWFLDEWQLRTAIHHCGIMLTENPGHDMPVPPTHYKFPAHRDLSWPQFHVGGDMVTTQEHVQKDLCRHDLARATTHTQLAPQPLFIERLLSKMPKDRERNTALAWPRGRKTAVDFFETVEEYSRIARHLGLEPDNPEMLGMARRHWGQATEKRISDQLASARPTKRRGEIPTELTQPGSGTATDEDVLMSEFSDDVNNGMEID